MLEGSFSFVSKLKTNQSEARKETLEERDIYRVTSLNPNRGGMPL